MSDLDVFMALPYSVRVAPGECSDGSMCYIARVVELEGCESHGDTPEEAMRNLEEAMQLYLGSMLEDGVVPPTPNLTVGGGSMAETAVLRVDMDQLPDFTSRSSMVMKRHRGDGVEVSVDC